MSDDRLKSYRGKRDFDRSPEPSGEGRGSKSARERFVIQKHDSSSIHYDFRLETEGVLASWAVPRGPSTDPREKRLAIRTEDHPRDYIDFEGVIPEDEYGAGAVMVWDAGPYRNLAEPDVEGGDPPSVARQIEEGRVKVWLEGEKIAGGYALVRTRGSGDEQWLLIKMDDGEADARRNPTSTKPDSVKTGRTMEEIRADADEEEH